ncbi:CHAT domain-containing tetratricopeptide repeat protein [Nostoc sp.]|uniref:CHAT domain-containing tetratricopeptide repeat protein n=1 Tax=Nostoc sp. TaxID=1180 RepID=UPI002FF90051
MNEQRQQAYVNLIQSLLNCRSNDEVGEILAANQELVDVGFLQTLEAKAAMFSQQGYENTANWLQDLAMQLKEALNLDTTVDLQSFSEEQIQAYFQFLMQILQVTADSNGDTQIIYPLLAKNTNKLDEMLTEILRCWGTNRLGDAEADEARYLAAVIVKFSTMIAQFPLSNKASSMEIAIIGYEVALTVRTHKAFPQDWAMTQNNLGLAYHDRIVGERAENLEQAITCLHDALKVYTFNAFPYEWASTQNNLGLAYHNRILGERAENLEQAIACFHDALKVRTFEAFPYDWAQTQNNLGLAYVYRIRRERAENLELAIACLQETFKVRTFEAFPYDWAQTQNDLGNAYRERIRGDKAENLELAIACLHNALKVCTFDAFPVEWAQTQNNFGNVYLYRIRGERADNLEQAITCLQQVLKLRVFDAFPVEWAKTQNNLGLAYRDRIRGEQAENLEQAIACLYDALKFRTFEAFPYDWAQTQNNLANVYLYRIRGERADNLEQAITCFEQTLKVRVFDAFPVEWATTQNDLGNAYVDRIRGEQAENLEQAIACFHDSLKVSTFNAFPVEWATTQNNLGIAYANRIIGEQAENLEQAIVCSEQALKVRTFEAFPEDWAMTQYNLASVYLDRITGERAENLEMAIACYQEALKVITFDAFPQKHAESLLRLGAAYRNTKQFTLAYNTFKSAIATVESLRSEIVSGKESKRKQAEHFNQVYGRMVEVCLELGNITAAIEYVERSKTRNLVEQILERDSKTIFPSEVFIQLEKYRDEIAIGQYQIQNCKAENPKVLVQHLQQLRQQRNELQNRYLPVGYGFKFDSFQATLNERTAIIEWYIIPDKVLAFIVTPTTEVTVWQSQPEDQQALIDWVNQYLQNYHEQKEQWHNSLEQELKKLALILHIDEILAQIPNHCNQLILIPHLFLHLLPLHALPITSQKYQDSSCLLDLFANGVSYAPSCQILQQVQQRDRPDFQSLFAIQNPTEDLNYTDLEVQVIQSYFNTSNVLRKTAATLTAINNTDLNTYHCAHFSCHGYFNLINPGNSALILANAPITDTQTKPDSERYLNLRAGETHDLEKCLTLDRIFSLKLEKCRLVTLSACETGLIDFNNTSDEYIGLPSGFLLAGSKAVVSSLWTVSDLSTAFLMMKFYENLQTINTVSLALNQAQQWLRNLTTEEFEALLDQYHPQIEEIFAQLPEEKRPVARAILRKTCKRKPYPFAAPFYWAGFTATGL